MAERESARVEAFSDGVFAIAMTLLILEIKVPHATPGTRGDATPQLIRGLLQLWPSFVAYTLSFGTILIMWVNHHGLFKHAHGVDNRLLMANGFLLLMVTFVPFPTAVLAEYLDRDAATVAATFYCGAFVAVSLGYNLVLGALVANRREPVSEAHERTLARVRRAYRLGLMIYSLATLVSLINAAAGLVICLSLWILWVRLRYSPRADAP